MENRKLKLFYIMLAIFLFSIVLGCAEQELTSTQQANVTISSPSNGGNISVNEPIIGNSTGIYGSGLHLYVLINPVANGNDYWVQPEAVVSPDGSWYANVQFGRSAQEDMGAKFWITTIVTPDTLHVGKVLISNLSEVKFSTKRIVLTRKDSDPITDSSEHTQVIVALIGAVAIVIVGFINRSGKTK